MKPKIYDTTPSREYFFDEGCHILEIANTPDSPDISIARARVEPGVTTRWHRLKGITERYVICEGTGRMEAGELPARDVGPHDVIEIPPMCPQRITNTGNADLVFMAVCTPRFDKRAYEDIEESAGGGGKT